MPRHALARSGAVTLALLSGCAGNSQADSCQYPFFDLATPQDLEDALAGCPDPEWLYELRLFPTDPADPAWEGLSALSTVLSVDRLAWQVDGSADHLSLGELQTVGSLQFAAEGADARLPSFPSLASVSSLTVSGGVGDLSTLPALREIAHLTMSQTHGAVALEADLESLEVEDCSLESMEFGGDVGRVEVRRCERLTRIEIRGDVDSARITGDALERVQIGGDVNSLSLACGSALKELVLDGVVEMDGYLEVRASTLGTDRPFEIRAPNLVHATEVGLSNLPLRDLSGFPRLETTTGHNGAGLWSGYLRLEHLPYLASLDGLASLTQLGGAFELERTAVTQLEPLYGVEVWGGVYIDEPDICRSDVEAFTASGGSWCVECLVNEDC